jgi:VWFA-related protein
MVVVFLCSLLGVAQNSPATRTPAPPTRDLLPSQLQTGQATSPTGTTIKSATRLVLIDVIATGKDDKPIKDLKIDDFVVTEKGKPQRLSVFERFTPVAGDNKPLPPNYLSNRPALQGTGVSNAVTIILLDGLNTKTKDQAYVKQELLKFLKNQYKSSQSTAVLALTSEVRVLQDFTTDPNLLRKALESYNVKESTTYNRERTPAGEAAGMSDAIGGTAAYEHIVANINFFAAEQVSRALEERVNITMATMREIARATAGYPGRKNLIWVSSAFPFDFTPETPDRLGFSVSFADQFKLTEALLTQARVSLYPVDAVGLQANLGNDAQTAGIVGRMGGYSNLARAGDADYAESRSSKMVMEELASQTGGRAFYNRNDVDNAVAVAATEGTESYVIGYYPEDKTFDGKFRKLQVKVNRPDVKLRYRTGYYAIDISRPVMKAKDATKARQEEIRVVLSDPFPATAVTIDARVIQPQPGSKEATVQVIVYSKTLRTIPQSDGGEEIDIDLLVAAYDKNGKMVANAGRSQAATFAKEQIPQFRMQGPMFNIPLNLDPGDYTLKIAVRDALSGAIGMTRAPIHIGPVPAAASK